MALTFNNHGFIIPSRVLTSSIEEFRIEFVDNFPNSRTRQEIFNSFQNYIRDFALEISSTFSILINGSFVTKKQNPNDIDFVLFLDQELFDTSIDLIERKFDTDEASIYYTKKIHAFIVRKVEHKKEGYWEYKVARAYWLRHFEKTKRRVRNRKKVFWKFCFHKR